MSQKGSRLNHLGDSLLLVIFRARDLLKAQGLITCESDIQSVTLYSRDKERFDSITATCRNVLADCLLKNGKKKQVYVKLTRSDANSDWKVTFAHISRGENEMSLDISKLTEELCSDAKLRAHYELFVRIFNQGTWENKKPTFQVECGALYNPEVVAVEMGEFLKTAQVQMYHPVSSGSTDPQLLSMPMQVFLLCTGMDLGLEVLVEINRLEIAYLMGSITEQERFLGVNQYLRLTPERWEGYLPLPHNQSNGRYSNSIRYFRITTLINQGIGFRLIAPDHYLKYPMEAHSTADLLQICEIEVDDCEVPTQMFPRISLQQMFVAVGWQIASPVISIHEIVSFLCLWRFPNFMGYAKEKWLREIHYVDTQGKDVYCLVCNKPDNDDIPEGAISITTFFLVLCALRDLSTKDGRELWPTSFEEAWSVRNLSRNAALSMVWFRRYGVWPNYRTVSLTEKAISETVFLDLNKRLFHRDGCWLIQQPLTWEMFKQLYEEVISPLDDLEPNDPRRIEAVLTFIQKNLEQVTVDTLAFRRKYVEDNLEHWYDAV